jgi:NADH-quinone oxidoreductase subunit N
MNPDLTVLVSLRDLELVAPFLIMGLGSFLVMLLEVTLKGNWSRGFVTMCILLAALVSAVWFGDSYGPGVSAFGGFVAADRLALFSTLLLTAGAVLVLLLCIDRFEREGITAPGEFCTLYLMTTSGAILFANASELLTLFVGLELMSLCLYPLCGAALGRKGSAESALKYFLLGSFSSAFLLYGIALVYGLTGHTDYASIAEVAGSLDSGAFRLALGLILVGLVFKVGAAPFHFWAPDVYEGAPTSVTAFMATVIKSASVLAAMRVLWLCFGANLIGWTRPLWLVAVLTMTLGNLIALRQRGLKRMLAYSSIAHAGYLLVALLVPYTNSTGGAAILYYLVAYTLVSVGAFAVVLAVTAAPTGEERSDDITVMNGLGKRRPLLAFAMTVFLFSLAGIPPGMAGLVGKIYLFSAAVNANLVGIVIIGVLNSAVSCYYYLRVIVAMYFIESENEREEVMPIGVPIAGAIAACAILAVVFGVFPSGFYREALRVMASIQLG